MSRRLSAREGGKIFRRIPPIAGSSVEADSLERYNRVVEGTIQIFRRKDYEAAGGKVIVNRWGYTDDARHLYQADLKKQFFDFFLGRLQKKIHAARLSEIPKGARLVSNPLVTEEILLKRTKSRANILHEDRKSVV